MKTEQLGEKNEQLPAFKSQCNRRRESYSPTLKPSTTDKSLHRSKRGRNHKSVSTGKSPINAAAPNHLVLDKENVTIESLLSRIFALEAKLVSEKDKDRQFEQLRAQLEAATESNDRLIQAIEEMERQHA